MQVWQGVGGGRRGKGGSMLMHLGGEGLGGSGSCSLWHSTCSMGVGVG